MLINFSNHPSERWSAPQRAAAEEDYGEIIDIMFPAVDAGASGCEVLELAEQHCAMIEEFSPDAVLCQGEFSLSFALTALLLDRGIKVICACSERDVEEMVDENGDTVRKTVFRFVRFREYKLPNRA